MNPPNPLNPALKIKAEYVSVEDFKTYTGIDLTAELPEDRSPDLFLRDAEDELISFANRQSWRNITKYVYEHVFTPRQMVALRSAILIQAKYMFENGDIMSNNGVDPETGVKFGKYDRESAAIAQNAINMLIDNGIISRVMPTRF